MNFWKQKEKDIVMHNDKMNITESCVDRHAKKTPEKLSLVFEDENNNQKSFTYKQLQEQTNKFANMLKSSNIKNSHVAIFLPKCPELYIAFLGTIKSGNIPVPLFEAFQQEGLELRLSRGDIKTIITNSELGERLRKIKFLKNIFIIDSQKYRQKIKSQLPEFKPVLKNKNETAIMMFTSSTAGTPVAGIQLPHYGLVQQHFTAQLVLDLKPDDKYWCTAHPGWVTGAIYGIIAPLSIGCTTYIYQPHFNDKKFLEFLTKNQINIMYTAPTALRLLKSKIRKSDLKNLKVLASVGEALTKTTFEHYKKLGIEITDTYWQTETGAMVICNTPETIKKPGSIGKAIPGIKAEIKNHEIVIEKPWPAMMTGIYKHEKMYKNYFDGKWFKTNDLAIKDKQGYFHFKSRHDDIIKTSGERVSPIEVESILMKHPAVKEAAVIGTPDKIKGSILKAFIVLNENAQPSQELKQELGQFVKQNYAGHSYPKAVEFIKELPKTNSGKIIRMKLRKTK